MKTWVLLRGLARESGHWGNFLHQMQAAWPADRLIALDLPGNGGLNGQRSPLRVESMVRDCRDQLAGLGAAPPFHLIGMSLGGMVATSWMQTHPDELAGGVLINASMRPVSSLLRRLRPGAWAPLLHSVLTHDPRAAEAAILQVTSNLPERRSMALAGWTALRRERPVSSANALRQLLAAARFKASPTRPAVPLLLLCSRADRLVHPWCSMALARRWHCSISVHAHAGHDLTLDAGDWVTTELVRHFAARTRS